MSDLSPEVHPERLMCQAESRDECDNDAHWTRTDGNRQTVRLSHHVSDSEALEEALANGFPATADCGQVYVPSRDPDHFDVCPRCFTATMRRGWYA